MQTAIQTFNPVLIDRFITELCSIPEKDFKIGTIYNFLLEHPVEIVSLKPYLFFSKKFYTRNLIFKNDLFEVMTLCWEIGQESRIHNHSEQNCWMTIPMGKLLIQNFKELESKESENFCRIEPSTAIVISNEVPAAEVDAEEPIHQVCNLERFSERAVSLHIYSKPYNKCLVYTPKKNHVQEVNLFYSSIEGKLCEGIKL
jgi:cysteine dioxygenase